MSNNFSFVLPVQLKYPDPFYSSIPVKWEDLEDCRICLPCVRDSFTPPVGAKIVLDDQGVVVE